MLLIYGGMHRSTGPPDSGRTITTLIEQKTGIRAYVIVPLKPLTTDPGGVFPRLAAYPRGTVIPTTGSWLGKVSARRHPARRDGIGERAGPQVHQSLVRHDVRTARGRRAVRRPARAN